MRQQLDNPRPASSSSNIISSESDPQPGFAFQSAPPPVFVISSSDEADSDEVLRTVSRLREGTEGRRDSKTPSPVPGPSSNTSLNEVTDRDEKAAMKEMQQYWKRARESTTKKRSKKRKTENGRSLAVDPPSASTPSPATDIEVIVISDSD